MRKIVVVAISAVLILAGGVTGAYSSTWKIDTDHSAANFAIQHMAISKVKGTFSNVAGTIEFHESGPNPFTLEITIDPVSVDTGVKKRDDHLRSPDFFDVEKFPNILFTSDKVVAVADGKYQVEGTLDMHGITKTVSVILEGLDVEVTDPWGNNRKGAEITSEIDREDFGIIYNSVLKGGNLLIGDIAEVRVDLEFIQN